MARVVFDHGHGVFCAEQAGEFWVYGLTTGPRVVPSEAMAREIAACAAPERPTPNDADRAEAERVYEAGLAAQRFHMAHDRADYVAAYARAAMQKRLQAEHRARFVQPKKRAA